MSFDWENITSSRTFPGRCRWKHFFDAWLMMRGGWLSFLHYHFSPFRLRNIDFHRWCSQRPSFRLIDWLRLRLLIDFKQNIFITDDVHFFHEEDFHFAFDFLHETLFSLFSASFDYHLITRVFFIYRHFFISFTKYYEAFKDISLMAYVTLRYAIFMPLMPLFRCRHCRFHYFQNITTCSFMPWWDITPTFIIIFFITWNIRTYADDIFDAETLLSLMVATPEADELMPPLLRHFSL